MANKFFSQFPLIDYDVTGEGSFITLTNIVKNVDVDELQIDNTTSYTFHNISDGERPDIVSYKLYGNSNLYWTFFILNNELRDGLNSAWPLSQQQMDRMIEKEYANLSVISFLPETNSNFGTISFAQIYEPFTKYLRLENDNKQEWAKILRYDSHRHQLIVYDVEKSSIITSATVSSVDRFINDSTSYSLVWFNPYVENSDEWILCEDLKRDFVNLTISQYRNINTPGSNAIVDQGDGWTADQIQQNIYLQDSAYVFHQNYKPASAAFRWVSMYNAAALYYSEENGKKYSRTAYDILSNPNIINPTFISFYEKEMLENESKSKIRVILPNKIQQFIVEYFKLLNYDQS